MRLRSEPAIWRDDPAVCAVRTLATAAEVLHAGDLDADGRFVVDQRMPKMSGMELIDALRRQQIRALAILIIPAIR
jgi:FixJ family two-component response regulator